MKMNFKLLLLFPAFVVLLLWGGCSSDDKDDPITPSKPEITLNDDSEPVISSEGGNTTISFKTNTDWQATVSQKKTESSDWCKISPTSGKAGLVNLTITTEENETYSDRSVNVLIAAGELTKNISVLQRKKGALILSTPMQKIDQEGGYIDFELKTNLEYDVEIEAAAKSWLELAPKTKTTDLPAYNIRLSVANSTEASRIGKVIVVDKEKALSDTAYIIQASLDKLVLSPTEYALDTQRDTTLTLSTWSRVEIKPLNEQLEWLSITKNENTYFNEFQIKIKPNQEYISRSAILEFVDPNTNEIESVSITQNKKGAIILSDNSRNLKIKGGIIDVELKTNIDWIYKVSHPNSIKKIETKTKSGLTSHNLSFEVNENTEDDIKKMYIAFTNEQNTIKDTLKIYQTGWDSREADSLSLVALYNAMDGAKWNFVYYDYRGDQTWKEGKPWQFKKPMEEWNGVRVENSRVTELDLGSLSGFKGSIPSGFCNLRQLKRISFSAGYQTTYIESLPENFGDLKNLRDLSFWNCAYSDNQDVYKGIPSIPESFEKLTKLETFSLRGAMFTKIPPVIFKLTNLRCLWLAQMKWEQEIPSEIGNLVNLQRLMLTGFHTCEVGPIGFKGNIPSSITKLNKLYELEIYSNNFYGNIPSFIGNMASLENINLSSNNFNGAFPESLANLSKLNILNITENKLIGNIPQKIKNNANYTNWLLNGSLLQLDGFGFENLSLGKDTYHADRSHILYQKSTKSNPINIVIMGDGFIKDDNREEGAYEIWAKKAADALFSVEPYKTYKEYFNVYISFNYSNQRGYTLMNQIKDTYFSTSFNGSNWNTNSSKCFDVSGNILGSNKVKDAVNVLLLNTTDSWYPGVCLSFSDGSALTIDPLTSGFDNVIIHEAGGHGFGKLGDEYISASEAVGRNKSDAQYYPNLDITSDPAKVKWKHFIGHPDYPEVGVFEGGYYFGTGVWRPTLSSVMNSSFSDNNFNAPSREAIVKRIKELAKESYSFNEFVRIDKGR
ncbi:MAG: M64 family metallopeptidase [Dysgonomonas sp.]